jgi:hypothetical protein
VGEGDAGETAAAVGCSGEEFDDKGAGGGAFPGGAVDREDGGRERWGRGAGGMDVLNLGRGRPPVPEGGRVEGTD